MTVAAADAVRAVAAAETSLSAAIAPAISIRLLLASVAE